MPLMRPGQLRRNSYLGAGAHGGQDAMKAMQKTKRKFRAPPTNKQQTRLYKDGTAITKFFAQRGEGQKNWLTPNMPAGIGLAYTEALII